MTRVTTVKAEVKLLNPGAGGVQMALTVDGSAPPAWEPFREISILDLPGGDGEKKVTLRLRDQKGAESPPVSATVRLDTTPPLSRVQAPERVAGSDVRLTFDVPDAVALQHTENVNAWSSWELYSTPKTITLSKGSGQKVVFVRFRDEAGNESAPGRVVVEAQSPTPSETVEAGIRTVSLGVLRKPDSGLELVVWMDGTGLKEMSAELDGLRALDRGPVVYPWRTDILPSEGPRRLLVIAWDAGGREHRAEAVFLDRDVPGLPRPGLDERGSRSPWRVALTGGVVPLGVRFHEVTVDGNRDIERGAMALVRAEGTRTVADPLFVQVAVELSEGGDARVFAAGGDLGVRFRAGSLLGVELELGVQAGAYYSDLSVSLSGFGKFDSAPLLRAGGVLGLRLTDSLWTEVMADYRYVRYRFEGPVSFGAKDANGAGPAIGVGLSWRF